MNKKLPLLVALFLLATPITIWAGQVAGGQLYYSWISGNTYKVYFDLNVDCSTGPEPQSVPLCFAPTCGGMSLGSAYLQKSNLPNNGAFLNTACFTQFNKCLDANSPNRGFKTWKYEGTITLPGQCSTWVLSVTPGERIGNDNLVSTSASAAFVCTLNNSFNPQNSAPRFVSNPYLHVPANGLFSYYPIVIDPNGDSVTYSLIDAREANTICNLRTATYAQANYNTAQPWGKPLTLDTRTGRVTGALDHPGVYVLTLQATEISGNNDPVLVRQEIVIQVGEAVPYPASRNDSIVVLAVRGATQNGRNIEAQQYRPLSFCILFPKGNAGATFAVQDNAAIAAPGSTLHYIGYGTDSVVGCFNWIPRANDSGTHVLTFTIRDSACNSRTGGIPISQTYSVILTVKYSNGTKSVGTNVGSVQIFPNPATESIFIKAQQKVDASLVSVEGKVVLRVRNATSLDVKALAEGLYFLKVMDANSGLLLTTEKIFIKR